jgi:hypothetical protein
MADDDMLVHPTGQFRLDLFRVGGGGLDGGGQTGRDPMTARHVAPRVDEGAVAGGEGQVRAGSGTDLLLRALPGAPVLKVASAAGLIGRSFPAVNEAIARLTEADVLTQITTGKRNRVFEAGEVIDAFTSLERRPAPLPCS